MTADQNYDFTMVNPVNDEVSIEDGQSFFDFFLADGIELQGFSKGIGEVSEEFFWNGSSFFVRFFGKGMQKIIKNDFLSVFQNMVSK